MVEAPRQLEYADCSPGDFEQVLAAMPSMDKLVAGKTGQIEVEMNSRLQSPGAKPIEVGRPEMLGTLSRKTDAAGIAMLMAYKQSDSSVTMAGGMAVLRIRQRLLYAYLFHKYESPHTVVWLQKNLGPWSDSILASNR